MAKTRFNRKVEAAGLSKRCQCWDCVRAVGATPPKFQLKKHGPIYVDFKVYENPYTSNR